MFRAIRIIHSFPECSTRQNHSYPPAMPIIMKYTKFPPIKSDLSLSPVFIMHGMLDSQKNWHNLAKELAKNSQRNIYTLDARNHGASPHSPEHGIEHLVADIKELMRVLKLNKMIGIGYNLGGNAMMTLALNRPDLVERAVVIDGSPIAWPKEFQVPMKLIDFLVSYIPRLPKELPLEKARKETVREIIKNANKMISPANVYMILQSMEKTQAGTFGLTNNLQVIGEHWSEIENYYETIKHSKPYGGPILFIAGKRSQFIKTEDLSKIKKYFPNMSLQWLNSGHLVQLERPAECLDAILNFINDSSGIVSEQLNFNLK